MPEEIELQNKYLELQNKYNELEQNYNNKCNEVETLTTEKIQLQRHNQELFIRCTSPLGNEPNPQNKVKSYEDLAKEMRGK